MRITKVTFEPGDKVRLTEDAYTHEDFEYPRQEVYVTATKGSRGVVVTSEACPHVQRYEQLDPVTRASTANVFNSVAYIRYPVRFEAIIPSSNPHIVVTASEGTADYVPASYLEKLDYLNQGLLFILERVRVVVPDADARFKAAQGDKLLLLDFALENEGPAPFRFASPPRAELTPLAAPGASPEVGAIEPLRIDSPPALPCGARDRGQIVFQVPERGTQYGLHLDFQAAGALERPIRILDLHPGDPVGLRQNTFAYAFGYTSPNGPWQPGNYRLGATKNSRGRIVPLPQYLEGCRQRLNRIREKLTEADWVHFERHGLEAKTEMEECLKYPVLLQDVAPFSAARKFDLYPDKHGAEGEIILIEGIGLERLT